MMRRGAKLGLWLVPAVTAAAVLAAMPAPTPAHGAAAAPAILKQLEGRWSGKGRMRPYADAQPEPVSCTATYRFLGQDAKMQLQMSCATVNARSHLVAFFDYGAGQGAAMQGSWIQKWSTAEAEENGTFAGRISGSSMNLDVIAGGRKRAQIKVALSGARAHSVSVVGMDKGTASQSFSIDFKR